MTKGLPVKLVDTSFMKNVMSSLMDNKYLEIAAKQLSEIEKRYNISILVDPYSDSVLPAGVYKPRLNNFSYRVIIDSFLCLESFEKNFETVDDSTDIENLYSFITETQLVLQGIDFTNNHFLMINGVVHAWSSRAWGQVLAEWANKSDWGQHFNKKGDKYSWNYTDFYINMSDQIIKDYELWKESLTNVINYKCKLLLV